MNRKDLRNSETEWRSTPQRKFEVPKAAPKRVNVLSVLKWMAVIILLALLADNMMECATTFGGNSKYCVD